MFDHLKNDRLVSRVENELGLKVFGYEDPTTTLRLISNARYVISSKLHVNICGFALQVPTFGISSHSKTKRFFVQTEREDYQQDGWPSVGRLREIVALMEQSTWTESNEIVRQSLQSTACTLLESVRDHVQQLGEI